MKNTYQKYEDKFDERFGQLLVDCLATQFFKDGASPEQVGMMVKDRMDNIRAFITSEILQARKEVIEEIPDGLWMLGRKSGIDIKQELKQKYGIN